MADVEELKANLKSYQEQYNEVLVTLSAAPDSEELIKLKNDLAELIRATSELLGLPEQPLAKEEPELKTQIPVASLAVPKFEIGAQVQGRYTADKKWYKAVVTSISERIGEFFYDVTYLDYGNSEELPETDIRELPNKRKREEPVPEKPLEVKELPIPKHLKILPSDTPAAREVKKKKIHRIKSKNRLMKAEVNRNLKQNAWQQFLKGGNKKKTGFFTGRRKESIFKSPDSVTGKVGVTGSGKEMTNNPISRPKYAEIFKHKLQETSVQEE